MKTKILNPPGPVAGRRIDPVSIVRAILDHVGDTTFVDDVRAGMTAAGIDRAVADHRSDLIYDWMMVGFSMQGVSDRVAQTWIDRNGRPDFAMVASGMAAEPTCPRLVHIDGFAGCGYRKTGPACAEPDHLLACILPKIPARKGQIAQVAVSLWMFIRDACDGDIVAALDDWLAKADIPGHPDRLNRLTAALTERFRAVTGISDKLISMVLADVLIGADPDRPDWFEAGSAMIAIDSLVHNFFHRTGILDWAEGRHLEGPACYGHDRCAAIIGWVAREIDCRVYNPTYPAYFPRYVQHGLWAFCAEQVLNRCNGRQIDDWERCKDKNCPVYGRCGRVPLHWEPD